MDPEPHRERGRSRLPLLQLELATLLSGIGNGVAMVVLPWIVLERTGSAGSAGVLAAATAVPLLVSSLLSGSVVDTLGWRRSAVGADVLSAVSVAAIPIVDRLVGLDLAWLVGLAVLGAVFDPAGVTARETMLPAAAMRARWSLDRANGLHEAIWGASYLVGPGLGGVMIAWIGAVDTLWVTAAGFALSALLVGTLRLAGAGRPHADATPSGMWRATREGVAFVGRDPLLRTVLLVIVALLAAYMPIEAVLLPVHFEAIGEPGRLGVIVMAMSAGGVLGALGYTAMAGRLRRSRVFRAGLLLAGAGVLVLARLPGFGAMIVAAFVAGVAYGPIGPLVNLAMQTRSPAHMRGRVVGIITSAEYAAGPVGYLAVGAFVEWFGLEPVFLAAGGAVLAVGVVSLFVRSLRTLDTLPATIPAHPSASEVIDAATAGPVPLVLPPRDPH